MDDGKKYKGGFWLGVSDALLSFDNWFNDKFQPPDYFKKFVGWKSKEQQMAEVPKKLKDGTATSRINWTLILILAIALPFIGYFILKPFITGLTQKIFKT
jgi:hypothetical protein